MSVLRWSGCGFLLLLFLLVSTQACSPPRCGPGTVEENGQCVPLKRLETSKEPGKEVSKESVVDIGSDAGEPVAEKKSDEMPDIPLPKKTGESCKTDDDCTSKICLRDGYCSAECKDKSECPVGLECREINHKGSDGKFRTFGGCVRPTSKPTPCKREQDCPSDQSCVLEVPPGSDAVLQVCRPSVQGGRKTGEECNGAKNILCRNALCLSDSFCSAFCVDKGDCPNGWVCDQIELGLPNGKKVKLKACTPGKVNCDRDADCPKGLVCKVALNKTQDGFDRFCAPVTRAGAKAGDPCDPQKQNACYNDICVDGGFCFGLCKTDADCRDGFSCVNAESQLPKGKSVIRGCAPKFKACLRDGDCPKGLACALTINQAGDKITPSCLVPKAGSRNNGDVCKPGSQVASESCRNFMCLDGGYCSAFCQDNKDCPSGLVCRDLTVQLKPGVNQTIKGCAKP